MTNASRTTARITITLVMEVDREQWATEFGTDNTAAAVKADMRHWATQFAGLELPVDGELTVR